jgi:hypothetical protein
MAAEAIVDPLLRIDGEGRCFFAVEGTQAEEVGAATLELHMLSHHIFNWISGYKFVQK